MQFVAVYTADENDYEYPDCDASCYDGCAHEKKILPTTHSIQFERSEPPVKERTRQNAGEKDMLTHLYIVPIEGSDHARLPTNLPSSFGNVVSIATEAIAHGQMMSLTVGLDDLIVTYPGGEKMVEISVGDFYTRSCCDTTTAVRVLSTYAMFVSPSNNIKRKKEPVRIKLTL